MRAHRFSASFKLIRSPVYSITFRWAGIGSSAKTPRRWMRDLPILSLKQAKRRSFGIFLRLARRPIRGCYHRFFGRGADMANSRLRCAMDARDFNQRDFSSIRRGFWKVSGDENPGPPCGVARDLLLQRLRLVLVVKTV